MGLLTVCCLSRSPVKPAVNRSEPTAPPRCGSVICHVVSGFTMTPTLYSCQQAASFAAGHFLVFNIQRKCAGPFTVQVSRLSELTVAEAESSGTGELQVRGLRTRLRAWWVVRRGPRRLRPKACQYMNPGNRQSYGWTLAHQPCKCRHPHPLRTVHSPSSQRRTSLGAGAILTGPDPSKPSRRRSYFLPHFASLRGHQNTPLCSPVFGRPSPLQTKDAER
jgi:hypothetical protein